MELTRLVSGNESNRIEPKRNQNKTLPRPQISSICLSNSSDVTNVSISKKESYASILNEQHTLSVESIQRFLFICQVFLGGTNISKVFQEVSVTFPCLPPSDMLMWPADTDSKKALARSTSIYHLPYHLNGGLQCPLHCPWCWPILNIWIPKLVSQEYGWHVYSDPRLGPRGKTNINLCSVRSYGPLNYSFRSE